MDLTEKNITEFEVDGFTFIDEVFATDEMDAAIAIDELHVDNPQFVGNIEDPRLVFLFHDERLEAIPSKPKEYIPIWKKK
ncbi:MAG: hypothetical protein HRT89_15140 [Lentisphaeria bacterium]|nr:hypothetical protein [Lentisphaeria bacterium]NQZ69391.1 hypothetical protein [Lentisphaeria bacterium]